MKAVVLVGGTGTRLRPLTETIPKPLVPLVDRPLLHHVLDRLARHDVTEVLLSSPYLRSAFATLERRSPVPAVRWLTEDTPLGTGGAVARAAGDLDETFLVLNGDVLTDLDLTDLLAFHRGRGATATIALTRVGDARPYGLVAVEDGGRVGEFREKPSHPGAGLVNAGTYVLEPQAVSTVPADRAVSIELEVFPQLVSKGRVFGFVSEAYWMDLGTPESYLQATFDALEGRIDGLSYSAPHVDPAARISLRARLGRWVVAGPGVVVGDDAEVEDSVLLEDAGVEAGARVRGSILGPGAVVGRGATVEDAVLAEGARIPAGATTSGARVGAGAVLES